MSDTGLRERVAAPAAVLSAVVAFAALLAAWLGGGGSIDIEWAPSWDLRLAFELDGLGAEYGLLATGIGVAVFLYASAYLPIHLAHHHRSRSEEGRFYGALVLFMVSMVGLATAQDLIVLFVFWDLTAIASYVLIGFDRDEAESRRSALMALLVTAISAVLMLIGILMLRVEYGTTQLPELIELAAPGTLLTAAAGLIALAALAKSAQVPLHFWLPRAMAAPTPVSAYLHSAAMVAAGVFLISRVHPLIAHSQLLLDGLLMVGLASMAVGGVLALGGRELKQILAHSTISQYGYVVTMLGIGGRYGTAGACFYVIAHALAKSALFMTAGAAMEATGRKYLDELGGLRRRMPLLAVGSGLCAAGLAALPLTIGFFKDELFFAATLERGTIFGVLAVAGAALTFAYIGRFWLGIFFGKELAPPQPLPRRLVWPVVVLGGLVVAGGIVVEPFLRLAEEAATATLAAPVAVEAAYHLDLRAENVMALATYASGLVLLAISGGVLARALSALHRLGAKAGPERIYHLSLVGLNRLSDRVHDFEVRDLRTRVAAVLVPGAVLVALGVIATPTAGAYRVGGIAGEQVPLALALVACAVAAVVVCIPRAHLALVLSLSSVGFALAVAYALMDAPDVALVAVLIETVFALLFIGVFALLPRAVLSREARLPALRSRTVRDLAIATFSGVVTMLVVWGALSRPAPLEAGMADRHLELAEEAHGYDVVTVILADFRGLDTLVEITVVAVALLGVATMLSRGRLR
jgi:multicomponent Na+:H+ antiporter subunit A